MIKHIHVKECHSTQELLKEQLSQFADTHEILVSCDHQLKGRGRGNRSWESLPSSLCFSFTLDPHPTPSFTAIELSVLVARFFEGSILTLKWPNDIWNKQHKKCCGILVQNYNGLMLAGVGLNLYSNHPQYGGVYDSDFEFDKNSWSLQIAQFILNNRYKTVQDLQKDWEDRCKHIGQRVAIIEGETEVVGIFRGLGVHGEAVLDTKERERHVYNGSLVLIPDRL